ncbi:DUF7522 family protein [Halomicrococcus gelatinilyticus]|uniref:DUF7522 family protein n=1 Tax=Halomicrococcus gelatinilyticus TaxID=1702103 RepID=UPI002E10EB3C
MARTGISDEFADQIVNTARPAVGDALRSVIYYTPDAYDVLYVRSDLYDGDVEAAREAKRTLVENERLGFDSRETYKVQTGAEDVEPAIGEYEFTVRVFSDGFVNRVLTDDHGVVLTTNALYLNEFEELAVSLRTLLVDNEVP